MICPQCGSPCRNIEGLPRSLVHELNDIFAAIEESSEGFAQERARAGMGIVAAAIAADGNSDSPGHSHVPVEEPAVTASQISSLAEAQRYAASIDPSEAVAYLVDDLMRREDSLERFLEQSRDDTRRLRVIREALRLRQKEAVP
jgi:hypothetical protein